MALLVTGGFPRFAVPAPVVAGIRSRRIAISCSALSSPPKRDGQPASVDWVEATNSFFEQDSRPIMLFDGIYSKIFFLITLLLFR